MSVIGALVSLVSITYAVLWVSERVRGGLAADILGEVRRQWDMLTEPVRAELPPGVYPVAVTLSLIGLFYGSAAVGSTFGPMVLLIAIPIYVIRVLSRAGISVIGIALSRILSGRADPAEHFEIPLSIYSSEAEDVSRWSGSVPIPRRSLLTLGASGSGKSETLKHIVDQLGSDPTEPVVVFDMKTDYRETLEEWGVPIIRLSAEGSETEIGSPVRWNLFREIEAESDADEIARALFPSGDGDQFFSTAGRQLFAATVKYLRREIDAPTNADLVRYWQQTDPETMYRDLRSDGHNDLASAAAAIDPDAGRQASGVYATAQQQVSDIFVGDFGGDGEFSIREYMADPQGRVLVLDYPSRQAETVGPLFRYLIDDAIKHGMADPSRDAYYLLDEIEHLSVPIKRIGELINVGRGNNCQAIISLQSVAQLRDTYGAERANALLSGMATSIILRLGDAESVNFAETAIGTHIEERTAHVDRETDMLTGGMIETARETTLSKESDFKGDFTKFDPGEAVIARQGEGYVHGRIALLE